MTNTDIPRTEADSVAASFEALLVGKDPVAPVQHRYVSLYLKEIVTRAGDNVRSGELPEIEKLAASIKIEGVLEPILVTQALDPAGKPINGKYSVVAGHRRLAAVRSLGHSTVPALILNGAGQTPDGHVVEEIEAEQRLRIALIENLQREDMNPLDKARGIVKLLQTTGKDQQAVAQLLGVAPGYVSQYAALLNLPDSAQAALRDGDISFTQARALCRLLPDTKAIDDLLFEAGDMTVAALEAQISHLLDKGVVAEATAEDASEADEEAEESDAKPKRKKRATATGDVTYYVDADFHPLKKEDIRDLMIQYKQRELKAETARKKEEYRWILKGITLAADLRLK